MIIKYNDSLFNLKKIKLDVQEEELVFKEQIFSFKKKLSTFESQLDNLKHKTSFTKKDIDTLIIEKQEIEKEILELETKLEKNGVSVKNIDFNIINKSLKYKKKKE